MHAMKEGPEKSGSSRQSDLVKKPAVCGLAVIALLALSATAQAGIIYSGLLNTTAAYNGAWSTDPDVRFGYPGDRVTLSCASASSVEGVATGFELGLYSWDTTKLYDLDWTVEPYKSWTFAQAMAYALTQVQIAGLFDSASNDGYATRLNAGDSIGAGLAWLSESQSQGGAMLVDYVNDHGSVSNKGSWAFDGGSNAVAGYVGLAFNVSGNTYYGWAQVSASINQGGNYVSYTLIDWAYDDVAGESIVAGAEGASTPVPEPASMLLLGSGLVGLAGFGKRLRK